MRRAFVAGKLVCSLLDGINLSSSFFHFDLKTVTVLSFGDNTRIVFEMWSGMNECDHRIFSRSGARFSKVPKLFGRISGDIILFVSSKRRRREARNIAVILILIPFTSYEKTSFTE